jgi:oligoendopeptidase F
MLITICRSALSQTDPLSKYVWDLTLLYPSDKAWEEEAKQVQAIAKTISTVKATMGKSAQDLANAMDAVYDVRSRATKLSIYGALRSDVNVKDQEASRLAAAGRSIEREIETAVSFLPSEIKKIGEPKIRQWLKAEPRLSRHQRRLNRILLQAPYTFAPEIQSVIESMQGWPAVSADGYFAVWESDLKWPTYKNEEGKEVEVSYGNYRTARRVANPLDRLKAQQAFLGMAKSKEKILGYLYTRRVEADVTIAKQRKFDDAIDALWYLRDGVPTGAYKTMIATAQKNKDIIKRYITVMAPASGVQKFGYQDFYGNTSGYTRTFPIDEALTIILGAFKPLGDDFVEKVNKQFARPILHLVPMPDKRNFYANQWPIAGMPSYTMMSYRGTLGDLRSLAGAIAGKVRYADTPVANCPDTRDDPPIYGNALLYIAEMMLTDYLVEHAHNKEEKLFYLYSALQRLWTHNFHHVINAQLDAAIQGLVTSNNPPNGELISATYLKLLRDMYPDVEIDPVFSTEWTTNSVPFMSYEAQFWVGAMASACILHENMKAGDAQAKNVMREGLLWKGETDLSYTMFKSVGIDLASKKTYQAMYDRMDAMLNEIERIQKQ